MKHFPLGAALALSLATAAGADPQSTPPPAQTLPTPSLSLGDGASPGSIFVDGPFQASINSDTQTATIDGTFHLFNGWVDTAAGHEVSNDNLTVTVQTPLTQGADFTNTTTLDGLIKATTLSFTYSRVWGTFLFKDFTGDQAPAHIGTWVLSLNGKIGTQQDQYYDPTTLAQHTVDTTPWQVGGALGYLFLDPVTDKNHESLNFSVDYQRSYQDGDTGASRTLCLTTDNCVTGFIGAPVKVEKALLTGDYRWIGAFGSHPLGIDVSATYDPINDAESVQIPIYLMADSSGSLTGGIRYNWSSDSHLSTIGVFASTGFSIFSK